MTPLLIILLSLGFFTFSSADLSTTGRNSFINLYLYIPMFLTNLNFQNPLTITAHFNPIYVLSLSYFCDIFYLFFVPSDFISWLRRRRSDNRRVWELGVCQGVRMRVRNSLFGAVITYPITPWSMIWKKSK